MAGSQRSHEMRKWRAIRLACSHKDTNWQSRVQPHLVYSLSYPAPSWHYYESTHLNFLYLNPFLSSKTHAGSLKGTANELTPVDRVGNSQYESVKVNLKHQIKSLSKCQHLIKPFSLRFGVACTWPLGMQDQRPGKWNLCVAMKDHL